MTKKRDYIGEIVSRRARLLRRTKRWDQTQRRLHPIVLSFYELKQHFSQEKKIRYELYKYIPIGAIACIEGWYRMAIADLIDHGSPFRENVERLAEVRFDARSVIAMHDKKSSIGEFIAHFLPLNRFEDLVRSFSIVMDDNFIHAFKTVQINPENAPHPVTLESDAQWIIQGVQKTFELRHIFCHELATSIKLSAVTIEGCAASTVLLLAGAERVVQSLVGENT